MECFNSVLKNYGILIIKNVLKAFIYFVHNYKIQQFIV